MIASSWVVDNKQIQIVFHCLFSMILVGFHDSDERCSISRNSLRLWCTKYIDFATLLMKPRCWSRSSILYIMSTLSYAAPSCIFQYHLLGIMWTISWWRTCLWHRPKCSFRIDDQVVSSLFTTKWTIKHTSYFSTLIY